MDWYWDLHNVNAYFCCLIWQIYERFNADSIAKADDARLEYFTKKVD